MSEEKHIPVHNLTYQEFQLTTLENGHPENFNDVHRHNFCEILWFKEVKDDSHLELDFENYHLKNNQICIIAPGQVFNMKLRGEKGYVFAISREIFQEICDVELILTNGAAPFFPDNESRKNCQGIIKLLEDEYHGNCRMNLIKAYLKAFCIIITEDLTSQEPLLHDKQRIQKLITLIDTYYITQKETRYYAEKLSISAHHLNDIVRISRGTTVKKMIAQRLLLEAKRELSFGALTVKEVAFRLGFNDSSYFSRFFKKHSGYSPEQFKNMND
ncbi:helix-turn-helix domain-containing protein [Chryseobacterium sp. CKR4-1]|uniref:helix-turn-helix domain-containing protein n=1 Tax=Chryseobacterium sp. CKR4-1 TaxID=3068896 RepID=UPI002796970E|nr:helix-turn-helix domain-containing protein [Chryseobacterium sp. CKR4-1]MDQ1803243.1 helix-turn-helix domain-containing protein [Chryseobacterium sp. CKR4-1]